MVAMVMIIAYHIFLHCINVQLTDLNSIKELENDWFCQPEFSNQLCRLALIAPMGQAGNAVFMLLTGYFMIEKKSIDLTKISKNLLLQLGFAAVSLGLISIYAYLNVTEYSLKFVQFNAFNWLNWYVGYYFVILVVAKLFLNRFLNGLERIRTETICNVCDSNLCISRIFLERKPDCKSGRWFGTGLYRTLSVCLGGGIFKNTNPLPAYEPGPSLPSFSL